MGFVPLDLTFLAAINAVHSQADVIWFKGWKRASLVCASKSRGSFQLRIFDIRIGQRALALIPPFEPFISHRITQSRFKQRLRLRIAFAAYNGDMGRLTRHLKIGEQYPGGWNPLCNRRSS